MFLGHWEGTKYIPFHINHAASFHSNHTQLSLSPPSHLPHPHFRPVFVSLCYCRSILYSHLLSSGGGLHGGVSSSLDTELTSSSLELVLSTPKQCSLWATLTYILAVQQASIWFCTYAHCTTPIFLVHKKNKTKTATQGIGQPLKHRFREYNLCRQPVLPL